MSTRNPLSNFRLGVELRRRIAEQSNLRGVSASEVVRDLLLHALDAKDPRLDRMEVCLRDLADSLELLSSKKAASQFGEDGRLNALFQLLERLLVQQTEVLMMLRVVTFKDRPEDYELAMRQTQDSLPTIFNGIQRDAKQATRNGDKV